jgi:hypothetical protein
MARMIWRPALLVLATAVGGSIAPPARAVPPAVYEERQTVRLIPPIAGVRVLFGGTTFHTDGRGRVQLPAPSADYVQRVARVPRQLVGTGLRVEQSRWYPGLELALDVYRLVSFTFTDRNGASIDASTISMLTLKSTVGGVYRYRDAALGVDQWLHAERVTTVQAGALVRPIEYSVQVVTVEGTNVVNRSQQRFDPNEVQDLSIWLLFFPAEFRVRDALFGFPIGSSLRLTYPDGRELVVPLEHGRASVESLPRGEYSVSVDGPGLALAVPLALSRPQDAEIMFLSYFDLAAAAMLIVGFLVGLPLTAGTIRRRRARLAACEGEEPAVA